MGLQIGVAFYFLDNILSPLFIGSFLTSHHLINEIRCDTYLATERIVRCISEEPFQGGSQQEGWPVIGHQKIGCPVETVVFHPQGESIHLLHWESRLLVTDRFLSLLAFHPHLDVVGDARTGDYHIVIVVEILLQATVVVAFYQIFILRVVEVDGNRLETFGW